MFKIQRILQDGGQLIFAHNFKNRAKTSLKQEIFEKCDEQNDEWSSQVRVRVCGVVSDLHAADAHYHKSCRATFMSPKSTSAARQEEQQEGHEDKSLEIIINVLNEHQSKIWN